MVIYITIKREQSRHTVLPNKLTAENRPEKQTNSKMEDLRSELIFLRDLLMQKHARVSFFVSFSSNTHILHWIFRSEAGRLLVRPARSVRKHSIQQVRFGAQFGVGG